MPAAAKLRLAMLGTDLPHRPITEHSLFSLSSKPFNELSFFASPPPLTSPRVTDDPNCLVWQAFPIEHGRSCYQAYTGMNVTCTPPGPEASPTFMGGGMRSAPPDPAFRTDYGFATVP